MTDWLKRTLPCLAALACALAFLTGFGPPSIAFAQALETQTDTPALHFRDYGLRSLEPLLTDEARQGLRSGRLRPSLSTFLHPARYGLIAPGDAAYAVSVTELLCLNRENRSLQLACRQEDGTRRTIRLSAEACAQQTPLPSLLPRGCRPYVSTIEGRTVAIRRAQRPEVAAAQAADLDFTQPIAEAVAAPPAEPEPPRSQTGPPSPPAQVRDPPRAQAPPVSAETLLLRKENARLRRQLNYALGLPALLFLLVVGYTLARAARARKPTPSAQEGPAPDVALDTNESVLVSLRGELSRAREENKTVAGRLQRMTQERERAQQEHAEVLGKLSTLDERAGRLAAENARLREENATQQSVDAALRAEVTQAREAAEEAERRAEAAERAHADHRQAHATTEETLLRRNNELLQANGRLQRELTLRDARDEQAAREHAAAADPLHGLPRTTLTQDFSAHALHQPLGGNEETTRRLSQEQLDAARQHPEAANADPSHPPVAPHDEGILDFGDLDHDLPSVFVPAPASNETPTGQAGTPVGTLSVHETATRAHPTCPHLRRKSRDGDEAHTPLRAQTAQMPAAQRDEYVAATRQPLDDDQEPTRRDRDSLRELGELTQPKQDSGVWSRTDNGDRASIPPPPPTQANGQSTAGEA